MTIDEVIEAVNNATIKVKICVPSSDYYARSYDWSSETISIVDPFELINELKKLKDKE